MEWWLSRRGFKTSIKKYVSKIDWTLCLEFLNRSFFAILMFVRYFKGSSHVSCGIVEKKLCHQAI
jgi:hypothetical protein